MTTISVVIFAVGILIVAALHERSFTKAQSRAFIERQQMQSKIDTLTEALLQQAGKPVDLNKRTREVFKSSADRAFAGGGWKRDLPATPNKETK